MILANMHVHEYPALHFNGLGKSRMQLMFTPSYSGTSLSRNKFCLAKKQYFDLFEILFII